MLDSGMLMTDEPDLKVRELACIASTGLVTLFLCSLLTGCALGRVVARPPIAPVTSVAIVALETGFAMPYEVRDRLRASLETSLGAHGQVLANPADATAHMVATVERFIHHERVASGLRETTDFNYGTYRVRLVLLDEVGKELGSASVERDEFLETLRGKGGREEAVVAEAMDRATRALFVARAALPHRDYAQASR